MTGRRDGIYRPTLLAGRRTPDRPALDLDHGGGGWEVPLRVRLAGVAHGDGVEIGELRVVADLDHRPGQGEVRIPALREDGERDAGIVADPVGSRPGSIHA